jgi:hypothetical protein
MKKSLLVVFTFVVLGLGNLSSSIASALPPLPINFAAETCHHTGFFGLRPWFHYINDTDHFTGCNLDNFQLLPEPEKDGKPGKPSDVPLVLLAVVDDLLRIAGIVALAFVIVGAFKYTTSQGNPEEVASAKSTIVNALLGVGIAVIAVAFVSFLGSRFGG